MATSAIFQHALTAGQAQAAQAATPQDTSTPGTRGASAADDSSASSGSSTISANDFLTLLVTEMQNQDPTADTDPNEYINQLVQVNSLEQLIDINQTLSGDAGGTSSTSSESSATSTTTTAGGASPVSGSQAAQNAPGLSPPAWSNTSQPGQSAPGLSPAAWSKISQTVQAMHTGGGPAKGSSGFSPSRSPTGIAKAAPIAGDLGLEKTNPAATRVGHALAGRTHGAAGSAIPKAY